MNNFKTSNSLDFEVARNSKYSFALFKVGTCYGLWSSFKDSYCISAVINSEPGNGHLNDVFQWFEFSCKRDDKNLLVLECFNQKFYQHLLLKRGFIALDKKEKNVIKVFSKEKYRELLKNGNEILLKETLDCR